MDRLLQNEGFHSNDAFDKGGQTYAGISRVHNPTWVGWVVIDGQVTGSLDVMVREFYWQKYVSWHLDEMPVSDLVWVLFDTGVLFGGRRMILFLQKALKDLKKNDLQVDGYMGPETIAAIESLKATEIRAIIALIIFERIHRHLSNSYSDPTQRKFLVGWLGRAIRFL